MIIRELLTNLGLALVGVVAVALLLLVHPVAALLVAGAVLMVDLALFGELWVLSIRLNTVSVVNLVMAVGLAADYAIHIVHKFLSVDGSNNFERMVSAMAEIGSAVLQGGGTTMVGVIPLGFASSNIFRVFFAMLFGTAFFGLVVGMVIVPIALLHFGPKRLLDEDETKGGGKGRSGNIELTMQ